MKPTNILLYTVMGLLCSLTACKNPNTINDIGNQSFSLVNSDSATVDFPTDYEGHTTVMSFIYTHCPDVCPIITANMKNIQNGLKDTTNVKFVEISFDPQRDTPSILADYKELFRLNEQFSLLTGPPAEVDSLLNTLEITALKTRVDSMQQDSSQYLMKHSNTIYIMDKQGRIRKEYPANVVPPENVIEDLQKIR